LAGDGRLVDFGDSHAKRGFSATTLEAAVGARAVSGDPDAPVALTACQAREINAAMYGSYGVYEEPWRVPPELAALPSLLLALAANCTAADPAAPLGGSSARLFLDGQYAALREPLVHSAAGEPPPCFGSGPSALCVDGALPSLADFVPYSILAVQARPSSWIKSELDYSTVIWSAWGSRLLSEFGYGTIATSTHPADTRRIEYLDNNPAGHSVVVVREATDPDDGTINFSQFSHVAGTMVVAATARDGGAPACLELDGSDVYGAARADGWLDTMRRYACALDDGAFVLVDVLKVKAARQPLSLGGGSWGGGGPSFEEGAAHAQLHLEEYFYSETEAELNVSNIELPTELPFDSAAHPRTSRCSHVETALLADDAAVLLTPRCGLGERRDADGLGLVGGFAAAGGRFVLDGLVTSIDRWFTPQRAPRLDPALSQCPDFRWSTPFHPTLSSRLAPAAVRSYHKKRRFRFVADAPVGTEGDVRAFVLAPSTAANRTSAPRVRLASCAAAVRTACLASRHTSGPNRSAPLTLCCRSVAPRRPPRPSARASRSAWARPCGGR
jgi:hypothetical protein